MRVSRKTQRERETDEKWLRMGDRGEETYEKRHKGRHMRRAERGRNRAGNLERKEVGMDGR